MATDEKDWLIGKLNEESRDIKESPTLLKTLSNPKILALSLVYFGTSAGLYTIGIWAPQIIAAQGVGPLATGFLNAVPAVFAVICMILWARHSDSTNERHWHVALACLLAATGLVLAALSTSLAAVIAALILVNIGVSSSKPPLWSLPTLFLSGSAAAAGIATINSIGNLGGFVGPTLIGWIRDETGGFEGGLFSVAALLTVSAVLVLFQVRTGNSRTEQIHEPGLQTSSEEVTNA